MFILGLLVLAVVLYDDLRLRGKVKGVSDVVAKYEAQIGAEASKLLAEVKAKL